MPRSRNAAVIGVTGGASETVLAGRCERSEVSTPTSEFQRLAVGPMHVGTVLHCAGLAPDRLTAKREATDGGGQ